MIDTITNKDYITITANSVTVGGVPATTYRGQEIWWLKSLSNDFEEIQQIVQREYGAAPIAMRVMSSETNGEYAKAGNPSPKHGKNAWVSFVFANGIETRWVFSYSYSSASACAAYCAYRCGYNAHARHHSALRSGLFGSVADAIKNLANMMKPTNKDYITITANGVTVGGMPATTYRGENIWQCDYLPDTFKDIQRIVQKKYGAAPVEMCVMSSETNGEYAKAGNPSPKPGKNAWVSFVFANGIETRWVFSHTHSSDSSCAAYCALNCGYNARDYSGLRSGLFGSVADAFVNVGDIITVERGNQMMRVKILEIKAR